LTHHTAILMINDNKKQRAMIDNDLCHVAILRLWFMYSKIVGGLCKFGDFSRWL